MTGRRRSGGTAARFEDLLPQHRQDNGSQQSGALRAQGSLCAVHQQGLAIGEHVSKAETRIGLTEHGAEGRSKKEGAQFVVQGPADLSSGVGAERLEPLPERAESERVTLGNAVGEPPPEAVVGKQRRYRDEGCVGVAGDRSERSVQDVVRARTPRVAPQGVEHPEHLVDDKVRAMFSNACEWVQPHGRRIGRVQHDDVVGSVGRNARQNVGDEVAFRLDHDDSVARGDVLGDHVRQQHRLARPGRPQDERVECGVAAPLNEHSFAARKRRFCNSTERPPGSRGGVDNLGWQNDPLGRRQLTVSAILDATQDR